MIYVDKMSWGAYDISVNPIRDFGLAKSCMFDSIVEGLQWACSNLRQPLPYKVTGAEPDGCAIEIGYAIESEKSSEVQLEQRSNGMWKARYGDLVSTHASADDALIWIGTKAGWPLYMNEGLLVLGYPTNEETIGRWVTAWERDQVMKDSERTEMMMSMVSAIFSDTLAELHDVCACGHEFVHHLTGRAEPDSCDRCDCLTYRRRQSEPTYYLEVTPERSRIIGSHEDAEYGGVSAERACVMLWQAAERYGWKRKYDNVGTTEVYL